MRSFKLSVAEAAVLLLTATLLFTFWSLTSESRKAADDAIERAFESAEVLNSFAAAAHEHFNDSVNEVAQDYDVPFTTDDTGATDGIRYPATFSRSLTESFSEQFPRSQFRIYSEHPIRPEDIESRVLDDFATDALNRLRYAPMEHYRAVEDGEADTTVVRLASPIVMKNGCVACHNSAAFSVTERTWEVGDVRGVREVSLTIPATNRLNIRSMPWLYGLVAFASAITLFVILPAVRREVTNRAYLARKTDELSLEVDLDSLSKLHNRNGFDKKLEQLVKAAHEQAQPLTLLSFDIDHFKKVNDTYGHNAGDEVIRVIGTVLNSAVRGNDVAARMGGEEFAVIAAGINREEQVVFANRVVNALRDHRFALEDRTIAITVSAGCVALYPYETALGLYKRADHLLYKAKRSGRNQVLFDTYDAGLRQSTEASDDLD